MNKIQKEKINNVGFVIVDKIMDYRAENNLTKQKLAQALGISFYLLNKLVLDPDNSRISVIQKALRVLRLKLSVK